ncbi:hypothetical protein F5050DRAFT_1873772 [Lentinula boryana]|uniref:NTF2-like protein n=1 Tax=Lentinula boryana TaxID=40481 RepID=A0ABQ8QHM5_9AGAR|nr:hypothetical protein F5050DRAFT_1873772 [Lentinula boryana]
MDNAESSRSKRLSLAGQSTLSVSSLHSTALEICEIVYGEHATSYDAVERFYEASAIEDINLSVINLPRPLAVMYSFFRLQAPDHLSSPWIHALRAWTEIDDISETESFDGHRKTIVEHALNILIFPDIHTDTGTTARFNQYTESAPPTPSFQSPSHPIHPSLPILGTSFTVPSPFHLKLRIITRFSFNEQGRITHHRDFWDVKDVMGLVPGVSLAQWIGTRLTARGLSYASRAWFRTSQLQSSATETDAEIRELENGRGLSSSPAVEYARSIQKEFADSTLSNHE